jgi:hypothetical protein
MDEVRELRRQMRHGDGRGGVASPSSLPTILSWVLSGVAAIVLACGIYAGLAFLQGVTAVSMFQQKAQQQGLTPREANDFMRDVTATMAPRWAEGSIRMSGAQTALELVIPNVEPLPGTSSIERDRTLSGPQMSQAYHALERKCLAAFNRETDFDWKQFDFKRLSLVSGISISAHAGMNKALACMTQELRYRLCTPEYKKLMVANVSDFFEFMRFAKSRQQNALDNLENGRMASTALSFNAEADVRLAAGMQRYKAATDGPSRAAVGNLRGLIAEGYLEQRDFEGVFSTIDPTLKQLFAMTPVTSRNCAR